MLQITAFKPNVTITTIINYAAKNAPILVPANFMTCFLGRKNEVDVNKFLKNQLVRTNSWSLPDCRIILSACRLTHYSREILNKLQINHIKYSVSLMLHLVVVQNELDAVACIPLSSCRIVYTLYIEIFNCLFGASLAILEKIWV